MTEILYRKITARVKYFFGISIHNTWSILKQIPFFEEKKTFFETVFKSILSITNILFSTIQNILLRNGKQHFGHIGIVEQIESAPPRDPQESDIFC